MSPIPLVPACAEYREKELEGVKIRGLGCPKPIKKWTQCGLPQRMHDIIAKENYRPPFPIQAQVSGVH